MQIIQNLISSLDIEIFKNYWEKNHHLAYVNGYPQDWHPFGDQADHIDRRLLIVPNSRAGEIIQRIVRQVLPGETDTWSNYQRQALPHTLHVDEYGRDRTNPTYTIIIALDNEPRNKTLIFKEEFNTCLELDRYLEASAAESRPWLSDISAVHDVEHMIKRPHWPHVCNFLTFDDYFPYQSGHMVLFDTNVAHCTSNWKKYPDIKKRDLVQIHIGKVAPTSYKEEEHITKGDPIPQLDAMIGVID